MRKRVVLRQYTDWITCKVTEHHTTLKFDSYESELLSLSKGIDQGSLLSGIAFQFYNPDLVDIRGLDIGEDTIVFMDHTLLLVWGESLTVTNDWVKHMMTQWAGMVTHAPMQIRT